MMKVLAAVALAAISATSPAVSAVEQCRFIDSRIDREACYARQDKALAAKRKPDLIDNARPKPLDEIKIEDDRLNKNLRICRGC